MCGYPGYLELDAEVWRWGEEFEMSLEFRTDQLDALLLFSYDTQGEDYALVTTHTHSIHTTHTHTQYTHTHTAFKLYSVLYSIHKHINLISEASWLCVSVGGA